MNKVIDQSLLDLRARAEDFRDDQVSSAAYQLIKIVIDGECPETDILLLADRLYELTRVSDPAYISPRLYVSLAILENHLQRFPQALNYIDALLARSPGEVRALMMKMYFTSQLGMSAEHAGVVQQLQVLEQQGQLNQQQRYNLGLFTASPGNTTEKMP